MRNKITNEQIIEALRIISINQDELAKAIFEEDKKITILLIKELPKEDEKKMTREDWEKLMEDDA